MRESEDNSEKQKRAVDSQPSNTKSEVPNDLENHGSHSSDQKLTELFETARQRVKPLVRREAEAEVVTEDVLNFRLSDT